MSLPSHTATVRARVKQLSSVRAWRQTCGMEPDSESDAEVAAYESFPDLHRLLEEECAEIERRGLEAKASLEERIRRRNSDALSDTSSCSSSTHHGFAAAADHSSGFRIIGSLYRVIDPSKPTGAGAGPSGTTRGSA